MLDFAGSLWRYEGETWTMISDEANLMPEGFSAVYPAWIQGDDRPECATCKRRMRFVGQFNEHDLNFTGGGISYIFVCDKEHEAKLLMQR
jgi:hypothetical protein